MSFSSIHSALVQTYVDLALNIPTAYENLDFTPDNLEPWASVMNLPNTPEPKTLGADGKDEHTGVLQIDLNYPQNKGNGWLLMTADQIKESFKAGTVLNYESINVHVKSCGISPGRIVDGMYRVSISISWFARIVR